MSPSLLPQSPRWLIPDWPVPQTVRALSSLRVGGVSVAPYETLNLADHVGDAAAAVAENRRLLKTAAGLPGDPEWLMQVHGSAVRDLDTPAASGPADAAVTRQPGRICAILTADCLPVLLASRRGDRVGAAHAGWRGLAAGVIEATVAALGGSGAELVAWLGPAIGPQMFEIGGEVREALLAADPGASAAFKLNAGGRFMADLYALARRRLARLGIASVHGGGECTHSDEGRYFSHRRDARGGRAGQTGRQATLVWLEPAARLN